MHDQTPAPAPGDQTVVPVIGVEDDQTGMYATTGGKLPEVAEAQVAPPTTRDVILRVPVSVPDAAVNAAWLVGQQIVQAVQAGLLVVCFPGERRNPDGTKVPVLQKFNVLLHDAKDAQRVLQLAGAINKANVQLAEAMKHGPAAELGAQVAAVRAKDNAVRQTTAKTQGQAGGIIVVGK